MGQRLSRRRFGQMAGAALVLPNVAIAGTSANSPHAFRVRTLTAGVSPSSVADVAVIAEAARFLHAAKERFEAAGYEVQTMRVATTPLPHYAAGGLSAAALAAFARESEQHGVILSVGPVIVDDRPEPNFAAFASDLVALSGRISFSAMIASAAGIHWRTVRAAAEAMAALARSSPNGEGNFNFAAAAHVPPGTPFFPVGYHDGPPAFSIGLESPRLISAAVAGASGLPAAHAALKAGLNVALGPIAALGEAVARDGGRRYVGIDTSPAPGLDASIGAAIETMSGVPFGDAGTLAACAAITDALRSVDVRTCGYSGLMLPVLEDPVLARRAAERRYGVADLLSFSSVCGTGLDVVPLPGDTPVAVLERIIGDVAALSHKYSKPLSARLFPVPGKAAGEMVSFANPYLTGSVVMSPD